MATNYANYPSTQAKSKSDVDQMDKRQRLWDSLSYTYGLQKDESNQSYNKAISQQDRTLLGRGMQRSSYGMQTLGDLQNQKIKAANNIGYAQIADYENRLQELEKEEQEQANWQASFDENQRQFNENLGFQKSEAERAQGNWQSEYDEQRRQFDENMAYQKDRANVSDAQWEKEYNEKLREFNEQFAEQKRQYDQNFNYQQTSDAKSLYYNYIVAMAQNGTDPTDDLLAMAGLTRADYNALKAQTKSSSGKSGGTPLWKRLGYPSADAYKQAVANGADPNAKYTQPNNQMTDADFINMVGNNIQNYSNYRTTSAGDGIDHLPIYYGDPNRRM